MTLEEKVGLLHAQSKFCSRGVQRLGIPELWTTDGPHGIRPEVLWDEWEQAGWGNDSCVAFPALTCACRDMGSRNLVINMGNQSERKPDIVKKMCFSDLESIYTVLR